VLAQSQLQHSKLMQQYTFDMRTALKADYYYHYVLQQTALPLAGMAADIAQVTTGTAVQLQAALQKRTRQL
jgi:hypothetical protein